jgi:hypothetical protein
VAEFVGAAGNSATYSVDFIGLSPGVASVEAVNEEPLSGAEAWLAVQGVDLAPSAFKIGATYRIRITSRYETGAAVVPAGTADFDGAGLRARRATGKGNGNGGGADTAAGLAKSGATSATLDKRGRLVVKVRCSRKLEGACKIGLNGVVTKRGPKLTAKRHVRVPSGRKRAVTLPVKKRFAAKLSRKRFVLVRQTIRADKQTVSGVKRLRIRS